jgi:serine/threonine protein kinase
VKVITDIFNTTTDARRTLREISILRQTDHPNLCKMNNILRPVAPESFSQLYVIQNYGGWDLRKIMKNSELIEGWSEVHVKYIVYQMLCGLLYMKSVNIVHRDLKPSNLLMNDKCDVHIIDFGLAREIRQMEQSKEASSDEVPFHHSFIY